MPPRSKIRETILSLAASRAPHGTICPSEAARSLFGEDWKARMPLIREIAAELAAERRIAVTQGGSPIDPRRARGPIRLGARAPKLTLPS